MRAIKWIKKLDDWLHDENSSFNNGQQHVDKGHSKWPEDCWLFGRKKYGENK